MSWIPLMGSVRTGNKTTKVGLRHGQRGSQMTLFLHGLPIEEHWKAVICLPVESLNPIWEGSQADKQCVPKEAASLQKEGTNWADKRVEQKPLKLEATTAWRKTTPENYKYLLQIKYKIFFFFSRTHVLVCVVMDQYYFTAVDSDPQFWDWDKGRAKWNPLTKSCISLPTFPLCLVH